jgi:hypothetical protein
LQIVFGTAIFCLGAVRLYWRADFAKGQELFYGISAICAGLVGFFASQNRSFSMFVAAFLLCCLNVVFIFVPFLSGALSMSQNTNICHFHHIGPPNWLCFPKKEFFR